MLGRLRIGVACLSSMPTPFLKRRAGVGVPGRRVRLQLAALLEREQTLDVLAMAVRDETLAVTRRVRAGQENRVAGAVVLVQQEPAAVVGRDRLQEVGVDLLGLLALPLADDQGGPAA